MAHNSTQIEFQWDVAPQVWSYCPQLTKNPPKNQGLPFVLHTKRAINLVFYRCSPFMNNKVSYVRTYSIAKIV